MTALANLYESPWDNVRRFDSSDRHVFKYVFAQPDAVAETVLYRYPEFEQRTVICCSTQSGCPVGCRFCGTGKRFVRNLRAGEIVDQIEYALYDHKIDAARVRRLQFMFMSMGEPLLNLHYVDDAIRYLGATHPNAALLISTMGPDIPDSQWKKLFRLSRDVERVGLQFSVHESSDVRRDKLIPFAKKLPLAGIAARGEQWAKATKRNPFFNYCAHASNTTDADADRLSKLFRPELWECTISVICSSKESVKAATERQADMAARFSQKMLARGFGVRVFNPAGQDDIGGGCGQLWYVQEWMRERIAAKRKLGQS